MKEYSLTTYGLVPAFPALSARLMTQQAFRDNWEGAVNLAKSSYVTGVLMSVLMFHCTSCRPEFMRDLLTMLREQFGGVEEYLKTYAELTDADIALIRRNTVVSRKP